MRRSKRRSLVRQPRPRSAACLQEEPAPPVRVACISTSAEDPLPLVELFAAMPGNTGTAYVLVVDDDLAIMRTLAVQPVAMPVILARHGDRLVADHIHVIAARRSMVLQRGRLH